uniref:HAT C-terminal dimerisation domain-containing protein n=1 Tax=Monopterus albus TaxID=43700 RepID=A0A3Q3QX58_MONAL
DKCKKAIRYCGNTTNLHNTLNNMKKRTTNCKSKEERREILQTDPRLKFIILLFHLGDSPRAINITRSLAEMIAKDLQPLSVVEDEGFRNFVKTLDPHYRIPSRKNLMKGKIPALYEECHSRVKKCLDGANSVVLTTDMWTSRATEAYLTVSCHIIDENWQMQAYVLETCSFPGQHSAENICSELNRVTDEWANIVAAVRKAGWAHYPCFAHTLNLVVKDSIKALPDLLHIQQRCSAIVAFFHHSTRAAEKLKEVQNQLKFPEHKLIQSVETRWNSVFYMFERLLEQKEAVTTVLCLLGKTSLCLSEEDWSTITVSIEALKPFEEVTREISNEKHVSVSKVIPLVSLLLRSTASYECQGSKIAAELSAQCQRRFRGIETFYGLAVSTYLDARFKNLGFRDMANVESLKGRLITEIQLLRQSSTSSVSAADLRSILASQQHRTTGTDAIIEMRRYSEEKPIPRDQDPLLWWKINEPTFPSLSTLAKKHLGVIASSVPAERIFSKAGQLISQRRIVFCILSLCYVLWTVLVFCTSGLPYEHIFKLCCLTNSQKPFKNIR